VANFVSRDGQMPRRQRRSEEGLSTEPPAAASVAAALPYKARQRCLTSSPPMQSKWRRS